MSFEISLQLELVFLVLASFYLAGAAFFDYQTQKVPNQYNKLCFLVALLLVFATLFFEFDYFFDSLKGLVLGFLILLVPFIFRLGGAGDVKILSILGLLIGWKALLWVVLLSFVYKAGIFIPLRSGKAFVLNLLAPISVRDKLINTIYLIKNKYVAYAPFLFLACLSYLFCYLFFPEFLKSLLSES